MSAAAKSRPPLSRILYIVILFGVWSFLAGRLLIQTYFPDEGHIRYVSLETGMRNLPTESEWMSIYHQGQRLGYAVFNVINRDTLGYTIKSTSQMNIALAGIKTNIHMETAVDVDPLFRLDSFRFWLVSEQYRTRIKGIKDGTEMHLTFYQGEDSTLQTIQVPQEVYTNTGIQPMVASQGIKPGETLRMDAFDPASLEMSTMEVHHAGKEEVYIGSTPYELNRLELNFKGIPSILWLDDNGMTYREETVMGLVMERSTPEEAMALADAGDLDLLEAYAVRPQPPIIGAASLQTLTVQLDGVEPELFEVLESPRQHVLSTDPMILMLSRQSEATAPPGDGEFLNATEIIQCEAPLIQQTAQKILAKAPTLGQQARALTFWVFDHLAKKPVVSISSSVEILEAGFGDCSEHTTLFTALSRAARIPTRIHVGLVHVQGRFLYHAWPVIYLNGEWIDVDPTLGQFPADATHIALLEGDFANLSQLIPVLGNVQIRVLEQQYREGRP